MATPVEDDIISSGGMGAAPQGHIQLVTGPMFAGKTTEVLRRVLRYKAARKKCVSIKYAEDTRYDAEKIMTHDRHGVDAISASRIMDLLENAQVTQADVIAIDEGQFFPDLTDACEKLADMGKFVIVAALNADSDQKPMENVVPLFAKASSMTFLTAVCVICPAPAAFSKCLIDKSSVEHIGGSEAYAAACRECHKKPISAFVKKTE